MENAHAKRSAPGAHRLPADWAPTWDHFRLGLELGFTPSQIWKIAEFFRDYWTAKPGAGARKCDWDACFRVWMRREAAPRGVLTRVELRLLNCLALILILAARWMRPIMICALIALVYIAGRIWNEIY